MSNPTEPLKLTLEEAIQLLGPDEVLLVGYCGWEGMQYSVVEESSVKFLTHSYSKWEDALTDRLDRKVVARDEAAELKAAIKEYVEAVDAYYGGGQIGSAAAWHHLMDKRDALRRLAGGEEQE